MCIRDSHDGRLEAHLVIALAGAAVRHVLRAELVRDLDAMLRNQRARESGHERALVLVERVVKKILGNLKFKLGIEIR